MKVILKAFGVFEEEYDAPVRSKGQPLYFVHRKSLNLNSMLRFEPIIDAVPESLFKKARFEWNGEFEDDKPVYEFIELE